MSRYLFPLGFAFNNFSTPLLIVAAGLSGKSEMAADLSLSQAAMIAVFFSFSGNARNLILKASDLSVSRSLWQLRVLSALPLAALAFLISLYASGVGIGLTSAMVLRQLSEWFSELQLAKAEKAGASAKYFLAALAIPLLFAVVVMMFFPTIFLPAIYLWACAPLLVCAACGLELPRAFQISGLEWRKILPNYASTFVIGTGVFFFRLLVSGFSGKEMAGQLFTAFAMGSIVGAVYERTIGPSFRFSASFQGVQSVFFRLSWLLPALGVALVAFSVFSGSGSGYLARNSVMLGAIGFSLAGGFVMLGAQFIKINILHSSERDDVFIADLLSNFAILVSVPLLYLLFGEASFVTLFFVNALLVYLGYWMVGGSQRIVYTPELERFLEILVSFAMIAPVFFQLGAGLYTGKVELYDWGGQLSMLPLPISVFLCFPLILALNSYRATKAFALFAFILFSVMTLGAVLTAADSGVAVRNKLILSLQYLLPVFGLVLADHAARSAFFLRRMAKVFFLVVLSTVILHLVVSLVSGGVRLQPDLYFFSIYGNSQYASGILIAAYFISLFGLFREPGPLKRKFLVFSIAPMALYAVMSWSILSIAFFWSGIAVFLWYYGFRKDIFVSALSGLLLCLALSGVVRYYGASFEVMKEGGYPTISALQDRQQKLDTGRAAEVEGIIGKSERVLPQNALARVEVWRHYWGGVLGGTPMTLIFGHPAPPEKRRFPSAHNYYLDLLYNFGLVAFLPMLGFLLYTGRLIWKGRGAIMNSGVLAGLAFSVLFLLLADNSVKVGLCQPYPGFFTFFVWGALLVKLKTISKAAAVEGETAGGRYLRIAILNLAASGLSGGYKKYLQNMVPRLVASDKVQALMCFSPAEFQMEKWVEKHPKLLCEPCRPFGPMRRLFGSEESRALEAFSPDIIFVPVARHIKGLPAPKVVMVQNMVPLYGMFSLPSPRELLRYFALRWETILAVKDADAVVAPTAFVRNILLEKAGLPQEKVSVIPFGNNPPEEDPIRPSDLQSAVAPGFVFAAGSIEKYRGIEDLVGLMSLLKSSHPGIKLVIAGAPRPELAGYQAGLKAKIRRAGVEDRIVWLGNIPAAELSWCYRNCSVFVSASRVESFCFVALEALAHGCNCVSSSSPCLPEVFSDAAVFYKAGDVQGLHRAVAGVMARTPAERMEVSARAMAVADRYSWDNTASELLGLLFRVAKSPALNRTI